MISLNRSTAQQAVDLVFCKRMTELSVRALESRDHEDFAAKVFDLHNDFDRAIGIIDSNFPE